MESVMCLHFNMQEEDTLEHMNGKFQLFNFQSNGRPLWTWVDQPIHSLLVGCLNPCLQGTNGRVVSPQPPLCKKRKEIKHW